MISSLTHETGLLAGLIPVFMACVRARSADVIASERILGERSPPPA